MRRNSSIPRRSPLFLFILILLSVSATAQKQKEQQAPYALISGTVWTAQERSAPGVTVKIRRSDDNPNKARWELVTNGRGEFNQRVPVDKAEYIVWVEGRGHKTAAQTTVPIDGDEVRDIGLHLTE